MTLKAKRKLHQAGKSGNWRFKGLLLAALDHDVTPEDVANAWPSPGNPSDYRFLRQSDRRDPEQEADRRVVAEQGEERHRMLHDYVKNAGNTPKHLSSDPTTELGDGSLGVRLDDAIPRMLFAASTFEEVDTLFREQLLETVMAGAERRKIARDAANVINAETRRGDVPVGQDEVYATEVSEGGAIRDDREDYDTIPFDTTKFAQGARITDEMVDHAMVDIVERQIEYVGAAVENAINRVWLNNLINNAGNSFTTSSGERGVPGINGAYGEVDDQDFIPDSFVTHPQYRTTLFDDSNISFANRAGTDDVIRERVFDPLLSVTHYGASSNTYNSSENSWGFDSGGDTGAIVYDSNHVHVVMYNPDGNDIQIKDYDDPIRDLRGVNARVHTDAIYSQERAAATVDR
ncbi:hypothetical protein OSG_eHPD7_00020 [environmental Halophage eHP-D7]|jgi:hypothetical protein|nr:hypothetical protein OSG_eHPD7_00020 [environmental Halophage eHP-D7]